MCCASRVATRGDLWRLATQNADGRCLTRISWVEAEDNPPNWELISLAGVVLEFGPGLRWQISGGDVRISFLPPRRLCWR